MCRFEITTHIYLQNIIIHEGAELVLDLLITNFVLPRYGYLTLDENVSTLSILTVVKGTPLQFILCGYVKQATAGTNIEGSPDNFKCFLEF